MIDNDQQLDQAVEQLGRMHRALAHLRREVAPVGRAQFCMMAEGPLGGETRGPGSGVREPGDEEAGTKSGDRGPGSGDEEARTKERGPGIGDK